jgi:hypothetical protein
MLVNRRAMSVALGVEGIDKKMAICVLLLRQKMPKERSSLPVNCSI